MYLSTKLPESEVRHDPFSLPALIAWMKTKPADEVYCYEDNGDCLIGQYLQYIGIKEVRIGGSYWRDNALYPTDVRHPLPDGWNNIAVTQPRTFGAALQRAEMLR
jgi:hypothetical protein